MKFKTTQKAVKEGYWKIIEVGYCDLQHLLYYKKPVAYTCGVYGWNADVYDIGCGVAICTGYRPFGNIRPNLEFVRKYDKKAREIIQKTKFDDNPKEKVGEILSEFIEKTLKEGEE